MEKKKNLSLTLRCPDAEGLGWTFCEVLPSLILKKLRRSGVIPQIHKHNLLICDVCTRLSSALCQLSNVGDC